MKANIREVNTAFWASASPELVAWNGSQMSEGKISTLSHVTKGCVVYKFVSSDGPFLTYPGLSTVGVPYQEELTHTNVCEIIEEHEVQYMKA